MCLRAHTAEDHHNETLYIKSPYAVIMHESELPVSWLSKTMGISTCVEKLTPLDWSMPRTYIRVLLVFELSSPAIQTTQSLQKGLEKFARELVRQSSWACLLWKQMGVALILPRQRTVPQEMLEVIIMLRFEHMEALEKDLMWQTLLSKSGRWQPRPEKKEAQLMLPTVSSSRLNSCTWDWIKFGDWSQPSWPSRWDLKVWTLYVHQRTDLNLCFRSQNSVPFLSHI